MSRFLSALLLVVACNGGSKSLAEEILGEWEVLCRTDKESSASCASVDAPEIYKVFGPGGKVINGSRKGYAMEGTYTLNGDELVMDFTHIDPKLKDNCRARIEGGRLVLWYPEEGQGRVYGRVGGPPAVGKESTPGQTKHAIGGVAYTIALPSGYRLTRDDNDRQEWSPASGEGVVVRLTASPRPQTQVDGQWVTPPCNDYDYGGVLSSSQEIDGVRRDTSIGRSLCLENSDRALNCSAEHTRGYLEASEQDAALALCQSLAVAR